MKIVSTIALSAVALYLASVSCAATQTPLQHAVGREQKTFVLVLTDPQAMWRAVTLCMPLEDQPQNAGIICHTREAQNMLIQRFDAGHLYIKTVDNKVADSRKEEWLDVPAKSKFVVRAWPWPDTACRVDCEFTSLSPTNARAYWVYGDQVVGMRRIRRSDGRTYDYGIEFSLRDGGVYEYYWNDFDSGSRVGIWSKAHEVAPEIWGKIYLGQ